MGPGDRFECSRCGYIYDPAHGSPVSGVKPGTAFESLPMNWVCPLCSVGKDHFFRKR